MHRDLKPENILVGPDGQPKVLDFGIARITDADARAATAHTTAGDVLGTVPYMSPEQVAGRIGEIDERTDVHALGVLAFELVSGRRPYRLEGLPLPAAARVIQESEPSRLGHLRTAWRGDIETIIGKALEKERERRYASAADMATDIRRYLRDEPIAARSPSAHYRARKFVRRNKALVGGVVGVILALALGVVVATRYALREGQQRVLAEERGLLAQQREQQALRQGYRASLAAAQAALREGEVSARQRLSDAPEALRGWEWTILNEQLDRSIRGLTLTSEGELEGIALGAGGRTLSTVSRDADGRGILVVEDLESGATIRSSTLSDRPVRVAAEDLTLARLHARFMPGEREIEYVDIGNGSRLALDRRCGDVATTANVSRLAGDLAYLDFRTEPGSLVDWLTCDLHAGRNIPTASGRSDGPFSPDGRRVAVPDAETVHVLDVATRRRVATLEDGRDQVRVVSFVLGGTRIASVSWNGFLRLWDASDFRLVEKHQLSTNLLINAAVSPDGSRIAVSGADPRIRIWDMRASRETHALYAAAEGLLAFSDDGRWLAVRGVSGSAQVFDVSGGDMSVMRGHESYVYPVIFDREGARIYSGSWDGTIRAWDAETHEPIATLRADERNVLALSLSPDGRRIAGSEALAARAWDTGTGRLMASAREAAFAEWAPDGSLRAIGKSIFKGGWAEGPVPRDLLLDPDSLEVVRKVNPLELAGTPSPDGAWIVEGLGSGHLAIRSVRDGSEPRDLETLAGKQVFRLVAWSPDGTRLVATSASRLLAWDVPSLRKIADEEAHARGVNAVAFSPDGKLLATGGGDGVVRLWDAATMESLLELRGHSAYVWSVAWSPDGTQLVSGSGDGTLRAWDSVPLRERWRAREERRRDMAELRPIVEEMFVQDGDADRVLEMLRERYPGGDAAANRMRHAALDVALQVATERQGRGSTAARRDP